MLKYGYLHDWMRKTKYIDIYFPKKKINYHHHYLHSRYCLHPQLHHVLSQSLKYFDIEMLNVHLKKGTGMLNWLY